MEEKITQVRITFRVPNYRDGQIARIVGDFTDWVPITMKMHLMQQIYEDPSKRGEFFVEVKLAKGFRYRYTFEVDGMELLSDDNPKSVNRMGELTNYIEVPSDEGIAEFMQEDEEGKQVLDAAQLLSKQVSYMDGAHNIDAEMKKMTGYNALMQGCGV